MYAFSRDRAVPGWRLWSGVNEQAVPFNAVIAVAVAALIITLPALEGNRRPDGCVFRRRLDREIGLYIAYVMPTTCAGAGDPFKTGPWNLGQHTGGCASSRSLEVLIIVVIFFNLPFSSAGVPGRSTSTGRC